MPRARLVLKVALGLVILVGFVPRALGGLLDAAPADRLARLRAEVDRLAETAGGGVGVGVRHLETGRELYRNRAVLFPMGSIFKIPLAVQLLALVDEGAVALNKTIVLQPSDLRPGSGKLATTTSRVNASWAC